MIPYFGILVLRIEISLDKVNYLRSNGLKYAKRVPLYSLFSFEFNGQFIRSFKTHKPVLR